MSNFNNIWEEIRKPSEEPDRLTLAKDLQSHIKQVVGDTPDARSTLTSSIGYTFGPMVKLGIQSGMELQSEKKLSILSNSSLLQQNPPRRRKEEDYNANSSDPTWKIHRHLQKSTTSCSERGHEQ